MSNVTGPMTLQTILDQFREDCRNNRDLGDRFERLMQQFLRTEPLYAALFSEVRMWNEWPLKPSRTSFGLVDNVSIFMERVG